MPKNKDLKRLIRARMEKTGETYTAARSHLLSKDLPLPEDYAKLAGMGDKAVVQASGMDWHAWATALDNVDAARMEHPEIAKYVSTHFDVSDWWAQMITVAYERFRGLREVGQRRGGDYEVNKSTTIGVAVRDVWQALSDADRRQLWMPNAEFSVSTATELKSMRARLADGTRLDVHFTAKGDLKSTVSVQVRKIPDKAAADETRALWGARLEALKDLLMDSRAAPSRPTATPAKRRSR